MKKKMTKAKKIIKAEMHKFKADDLHSGSKKGPIVKNPKQALAISLSVSRKKTKKSKK